MISNPFLIRCRAGSAARPRRLPQAAPGLGQGAGTDQEAV